MWKRVAFALVEGSICGLVGAAVSVAVGSAPPSAAAAYGSAVFTGVLTGLLAGSPVWKDDGRRDAVIKALAGAFFAAMLLFGFRKWLSGVIVAGGLPLGDAPFVALPSIGVAIALVLEFDDEFGADALVTGPPPGTSSAVAAGTAEAVESTSPPPGVG
jgi:hypothetical protein